MLYCLIGTSASPIGLTLNLYTYKISFESCIRENLNIEYCTLVFNLTNDGVSITFHLPMLKMIFFTTCHLFISDTHIALLVSKLINIWVIHKT